MYAWYRRNNEKGVVTLEFEEQCSLGGCNNGIIAQELKHYLKPSDTAPLGWSFPISEKWNKENYSFIIDIKPNNSEIFLCELDKVYGYSYEGWSPIMLRLKLLYNDTTAEEVDKNKFAYPENPTIIYTMLYLYGSIKEGELFGTWNMPYGSITALLFWPEAMSFFFEQVRQSDPEFLAQEIKMINI